MIFRFATSGLALVLFLFLSGCGSAETKSDAPASTGATAKESQSAMADLSQYGKKLTGAEIKTLVGGHRIWGKDKYKFMGKYWIWDNDFATDGTVKAFSEGYRDAGTWVVKNDQLCITFKNFRQGKEWCNYILVKDGVYTRHNGKDFLDSIFTMDKKTQPH